MELEITDADRPPPDLRERYFRSLGGEPQVHHVERAVAAARTLVLGPAKSPLGYMAVHDGVVVEFWAVDAVLPDLSELFYAAAAHAGGATAMIKSYDTLALVAIAGRPFQAKTIGVNCTAWSDERFDPPPGFTARPGHPDDLPILTDIGAGLFGAPDEAAHDLAAGRITIYELGGEPVGCGVLSPVRQGADAFDVGVGVLPAWRRKGMGEQIVRHLKLVCLRDLGVRPTCGCAVENIGSRRTLERAGFLTRHRLLELSLTR